MQDTTIIQGILYEKLKDVINDEKFIDNALYDKYKKEFAREVEDALLNRKELWIGDIGYITSEIKHQGTKSGEVIKNVKLKFIPSDNFKKKINRELLNK